MYSFSTIQTIADRIASEFNLDKIILFGSYAYGVPTDDSDIDLLGIKDFYEGDGRMTRAKMIVAAQPNSDDWITIDLLLHSAEQARQAYQEWDPILRPALSRGKWLYERQG